MNSCFWVAEVSSTGWLCSGVVRAENAATAYSLAAERTEQRHHTLVVIKLERIE